MGLHLGRDVAVGLRDVVALVGMEGLHGRSGRINFRFLESARRKGRLFVVDSARAHAFVVTRAGKILVSPIRTRRLALRWTRAWQRRMGQ